MHKIVRFSKGGQPCYGLVENDMVCELVGDVYGQFGYGACVAKYDELELMTPCQPTKIVGVGLNYRPHVEEVQREVPDVPLLFLKPPSSVVGPGEDIVYPSGSNEVAFGAELAVVVGRRAKNVAPSDAQQYVLGYTCGNDVTARDLARKTSRAVPAKCFDTFCPLGPCVATSLDPGNLMIRSRVGGQKWREGSTKDMLFPVAQLVSFISNVMALEPGDVILTGTAKGGGELTVGDVVEIEIEGIGTLINRVVQQSTSDDSVCPSWPA